MYKLSEPKTLREQQNVYDSQDCTGAVHHGFCEGCARIVGFDFFVDVNKIAALPRFGSKMAAFSGCRAILKTASALIFSLERRPDPHQIVRFFSLVFAVCELGEGVDFATIVFCCNRSCNIHGTQ